MDVRIMGLETEYGLALSGPASGLSLDMVLARMFAPLKPLSGGGSNHFLNNGGRLYVDVGSHPEYATAELSDARAVLAADAAGELILADLAMRAGELLGHDGLRCRIRVLKNNSDTGGNTYGCHENYLMKRGPLEAVLPMLTAHLVTRSIYTGAGRVVVEDGVAQFQLCDRARFTQQSWSESTTRDRGMVNSRDEPHANPEEWRRLHVICGDSLLSQHATLLKLGTTHLVLRLLEERARSTWSRLILERPVMAFKNIALDLELTSKQALARGGARSAWEIQADLHARCERLVARSGGSDTDKAVLLAWGDALAGLREEPQRLAGRIEWISKLRVLRAIAEREGTGLGGPQVRSADLLYHEVGSAGMYARLRESGRVEDILDEREVLAARREIPSGGRARIRGALVAACRERAATFACNWDRINVEGYPPVRMNSPFEAENEAAERLLEAVERREARSSTEMFLAQKLLEGR